MVSRYEIKRATRRSKCYCGADEVLSSYAAFREAAEDEQIKERKGALPPIKVLGRRKAKIWRVSGGSDP
jgi:hypothetical protein